jgi:hypothetical protein
MTVNFVIENIFSLEDYYGKLNLIFAVERMYGKYFQYPMNKLLFYGFNK